MLGDVVEMFAKILFIFGVNMGFFAPMLGWVERKQSALMQDRVGANRAAILGYTLIGLFHGICDTIKLVTKEDYLPEGCDKAVHTISPFLCLFVAIIAFAVIPFGGQYTVLGRDINLVIADLDVGILFVFAFATLAALGPILAGWASNNNYSLLGGMRSAAQMLSYDVSMGLSIMGVLMVFGSIRLTDIGMAQDGSLFNWGMFKQPLGVIIFFVCAIAENKRPPFDMPEAESEIVAGYFTEYSGMKFIMFWMAEFLEIVTISGLMVAMFFGGWHIPFISDALLIKIFSFAGQDIANILAMLTSVAVFFGKISFMIWIQMLIRWTLPRFRYDQVMRLGWKMLLPLSLINIIVTGILVLR